jgi:2-methylcitrate dehydratase PrpD
LLRQFAPGRINRDDVWALIPKIVARHDPAFDAAGPLARGMTRMRVFLEDGSILQTLRKMPRAIAEPLDTEAVVAKYRILTDDIVDPARQSAVAEAVLGLDEMDDVRDLIALLAPSVRSAFD